MLPPAICALPRLQAARCPTLPGGRGGRSQPPARGRREGPPTAHSRRLPRQGDLPGGGSLGTRPKSHGVDPEERRLPGPTTVRPPPP
eukprot:8392650-Alexandrium_andersonii.AAC.1